MMNELGPMYCHIGEKKKKKERKYLWKSLDAVIVLLIETYEC